MSWRSRSLKSSSWRSGKELEARPGAQIPGDGGQEAEGSEAGGPGAGASVLGSVRGFRGVLSCPRVVKKARVTMPSLELRDRDAFPSTPSTDELIHCLLHKVLSSCHPGTTS